MARDPVGGINPQVQQEPEDTGIDLGVTEEIAETEPEDVSNPGGGAFGDNEFFNQAQQEVRSIFGRWAEDAGFSANAGQAFVNTYWSAFIREGFDSRRMIKTGESLQTFQDIVQQALSYFGQRNPFQIETASGPSGSGRRGSGGRGGPRRPTAAEIRAQFDVDQLANRANDIWFMNVLDDAPNAKRMAKAYVDQIVKNPEQKLDFDTFIRTKVEGTARYKSIYKRKPEGMPVEQYLMPLYQTALQVAPTADQAEGLATGAARFGGNQQAFQQRLTTRADVARNSAPFMRSIEEKMGALNGILRG